MRQCINSVLCQTLCDFELILVDDGSTDDSLAIIKEYADIDGRIIYIRQSNMYAGVARNTGMERANGEYLLFLDPDDFFAPTLLEDMYNKAESDEADVVLCDGRYYDNVTGKYSNARLLLQRYNIPKTLPFSYLDNPDKILHISIDCPWNKLFRKAFVDAHGLRFQPLRSANDVYFVDCAILLADKISVVDKKLVNYRTNVHTSLQATRAKEPLNFYEALGGAAFVTRVRAILLRDTGATLSPFAAFLLLQGTETLSLRVERHVQNALKVVEYLQTVPEVESVSHPSIPGRPDHDLYEKYFPNGAGSIFTFDIKGGKDAARVFIDNLHLFSLLANVADAKSLVIHPASTTHSQETLEELEDQGIHQGTIRLSIGTENIEDILDDLKGGFEALRASGLAK